MATKGGYNADEVESQLDEQELEQLYAWVDSLPLSIKKKSNFERDFSDGVYIAEIVKHHFPMIVDKHNYSAANNVQQKTVNWNTLNNRVFKKMNFELDEGLINDIALCKRGVIQKVLLMLQVKIRRAEYARERVSEKPEVDQHQMSGRKGQSLLKLGLDDTKGHQFAKTKHHEIYGTKIDQKYIQCKGWNSGLEPQQKPTRFKSQNINNVMETDKVPRYVVEEKEQQIHTRDETIQMLQEKVKKMEHLLHLKDQRFVEYSRSMETFRKSVPGPNHHPAPKLNHSPDASYIYKHPEPPQPRYTNVQSQAQTHNPPAQPFKQQGEARMQYNDSNDSPGQGMPARVVFNRDIYKRYTVPPSEHIRH